MELPIITKQDLVEFRYQLLDDFKKIIEAKPAQSKQWLRSSEVRELLNISPGTLQNLRINGTLTYNRVGGIIYYNFEQIQKLMEK